MNSIQCSDKKEEVETEGEAKKKSMKETEKKGEGRMAASA